MSCGGVLFLMFAWLGLAFGGAGGTAILEFLKIDAAIAMIGVEFLEHLQRCRMTILATPPFFRASQMA